MSDDVLVIGGGAAGLTAAYLLTKAGVATTVIESDPRCVGGISRTETYKGCLFDIGGHPFFSKSKEVVGLWNEILPQDFIERPRLSRIYYNGKFFSYPLRAFEALNNLGYADSAYCVLPYLYRQAFPHDNPETFHQWIANQFGERLFSIFFKTYTEKVCRKCRIRHLRQNAESRKMPSDCRLALDFSQLPARALGIIFVALQGV